jgi:hypothetical protein
LSAAVVLRATYTGTGLKVLDKEKLEEFKAQCSPGLVYAMILEPWEDARTRRQQGLLHQLLGRHARAEGVQMQWLKDRIKYDLGYWIPADRVLSGEVEPPSWRGKIIDAHTIYPELHPDGYRVLLRSEADYSKSMERDFIDRVIYECQESGTDIDDILRTLHELNKEGT